MAIYNRTLESFVNEFKGKYNSFNGEYLLTCAYGVHIVTSFKNFTVNMCFDDKHLISLLREHGIKRFANNLRKDLDKKIINMIYEDLEKEQCT